MKEFRRLPRLLVPIESKQGYQQALGVITFALIVAMYGSLVVVPFVIASITAATLLTAFQQTIIMIGLSQVALLAVLLR